MRERDRTIGIIAALMMALVAFFQLAWPYFYPSLVGLHGDPTTEYLRIMWILSPNGLSTLTVIGGCILIAWVAYTGR